MMYRFWKCSQEKLHFTSVHTLCQLKRDEALFPPLSRVVEFRARYDQKTACRFGGGPNLDSVRLMVEEKQRFTPVLTCDLSEPVSTCPQYSDHVRSSCNAIFCTFECSYSSVLRPILLKLHILTRLIKSFPTLYGQGAVWKQKSRSLQEPMLKDRQWKKVRAPLIFCVTSCPAEKCIFQLSSSTAFQRHTSRGAVIKKIVNPSRGAS